MGKVEILRIFGLAPLSKLEESERRVADLSARLEESESAYASLVEKITEKAGHHGTMPTKAKVSGAALRRMNEKQNAQIADEPRSNSEILKEQNNG